MPLNTVRLNHRPSTHPNDRIVFIKPLPRPAHRQHEYEMADTFLRAIAAQCLPIMKTHWLSVTTLEEYEPNSEFMGRNFNAGECIQLVLRRRGRGRKDRDQDQDQAATAAAAGWLPFEVVQMVMMHELAHNVHMNHSKAFWATRDVFAAEMKALWARRYTGEGFWGGGRVLGGLNAALMQDGNGNGDGGLIASQELADLPLCGGTYRSRREGARKRKRKRGGRMEEGADTDAGAGALTWKERKEKRIERKFGRNGVALGGDEEERMVLELGRKGGSSVGVKPRVAGSKRGRELRAAAALKRFEVAAAAITTSTTNKDEEKKEEATASGDDDDEYDDDGEEEDNDDDGDAALDIDGKKLQDQHGHAMTRVCEGGHGDVHVKQELQELEGLDMYFFSSKKDYNDDDYTRPPAKTTAPTTTPPPAYPPPRLPTQATTISCPICSLHNPSMASTCSACAHVFDISKDPRHWACKSAACQGTAYINSGDAGVCGLCGERKPSSSSSPSEMN